MYLPELLPYYERELTFLRQLSKQFAAEYPKVAGRLLLEGDVCEDPHVERLIEAFAFLTARIHRKLDDEYPEITESFLGILYPHFLRPIPSLSVAQFQLDPKVELGARQEIPKHTALYARPVRGLQCKFRTAYPVEIWPLRVVEAVLEPVERSAFSVRSGDTVAILRIRVKALGQATFAAMKLDRLRFYLEGEAPLMHALYELLFNSAQSVVLAPPGRQDRAVTLPATAIRPVGFGEDEGLLDYDPRSFLGYRLLQEYFTLPEKFLFFDVVGLEATARFGAEMELAVPIGEFQQPERLERLAEVVSADTFRLGCTPIVNLFRQPGEPIRLSHEKFEYQVIPDVRRPWGLEVYGVNSVRKLVRTESREAVVEYQPFYSIRHGLAEGSGSTFWAATRRPSALPNDSGTEVFVSLVDLELNPNVPAVESLSLDLTCTNRDLPAQLPFGGAEGDLSMDGASFVSRIACLKKPTPTIRPPLRKGAQWRLISHLSLNHLSIVEGGREALLEILSLYNFTEASALRRMISGVTHVGCKPAVTRIGPPQRTAFVRGTEIELEVDEEQFVGSGAYLFGAVLERFFALYCAANSYTQLTVHSKQREKALASWRPRTGEMILV